MNAITSYRDFTSRHSPTSPPARVAGRRGTGILRRIFDAIAASQQRRAEREIAHFLGTHPDQDGGRLTDEMERKLMEHFTRNCSFRP